MSGSGGGSWINTPNDSCATLSQQATLNSPVKAVLANVKKGDLLSINVRKVGSAAIVEALHNGQVAGTITSSIIQRLAECMEEGYEYVAEVVDHVQGGACRIQVRAK